MSDSAVFVAGHNGMVGRAIVRQLEASGVHDIITCERDQVDLTRQQDVLDFFSSQKIDEVYLAAAKVGGISANATYPAEFIYQNLMIQSNVINAAHENDVQRLLFLGSSCIYPKLADQPIKESCLLTGLLEETNEPYAIAKIAGIKMCQAYNRQYDRDYRSVMPTNLFGPFDNFHPENSHVIPGLIQKFDKAIRNAESSVKIWGTGKPRREFLHVDDMARASIHIMNMGRDKYLETTDNTASHINVGTGVDCEISHLAVILQEITGFTGCIEFDNSKPDGTPRKLMSVELLHSTGWHHTIELEEGLRSTWHWYMANKDQLRFI